MMLSVKFDVFDAMFDRRNLQNSSQMSIRDCY